MSEKMIQLFFIYQHNCLKCEQAKPLMDKLNEHPEIDVVSHPAKNAKYFIEHYNLYHAPSIVVYKNGRPKGVIDKGFTFKGLKEQIFNLTGLDIDERNI